MVQYGGLMTEPRRGYRAYLLRLWQVQGEGKTAWQPLQICDLCN